jgi:hypothetical protein
MPIQAGICNDNSGRSGQDSQAAAAVAAAGG